VKVGPTEVVVVEEEAFAETAARRIAAKLRDAAGSRPGSDSETPGGPVSLALSGGSTPEPAYRALADEAVDWERIDIFQVDERAVPRDHEDRNLGMIRRALRGPGGLCGTRVHPMDVLADDLEDAARHYATLLPASLDVVVLGIGEDAHTASLFPDDESWNAVDSTDASVVGVDARGTDVLVTASPGHAHRRMTLGPASLQRASNLFVLARGESKSAAVALALEAGPMREAPARLARGGLWILDTAAASSLGERVGGNPSR
jgi:6-phosphogluconolactonase